MISVLRVAAIEDAVKEWYSLTLIEVVLGAQGLRGSRWWGEAAIENLLSEEALTAAVQPRFFIEGRLKKNLAQALGQAVEKAA